MSTKLALLKTGDYVIADAKELVSEEKVRGYLFTNPHKVVLNTPITLLENLNEDFDSVVNITLSPWIILSSDKDYVVTPDWVVTIVEPINSLKEMYEEKVNGTERQVLTSEH
jgi:hypothetical protein